MGIITYLKKSHHLYYALRNKIQERTYNNGVKYIFVNKKSDKLIVGFSGIGGDYNYRRSLKGSSWDQLYIKDSWANGLSYHLYENGHNHPELLTSNFLNDFLTSHKYTYVVSLGSSKGGSSALYYGLKHKFNEVFYGACQYRVGDYIGIFHKDDNYYPLIMGDIPEDVGIKTLNDKFEHMLEENKNSQTKIRLIYSTEEHTYEDHILHLVRKLDKCHIMHEDQIETFPQHGMIGKYMTAICKKNFK